MQGDVSKVMQILFNLANNAMKWSSGAPVTVHVAVTDEPALALTGMRMLVINVADRGPGLTDEQRESIFRPFSRANPETAGGPGGAGIGLHLSRSFARALGGDVSVHSVLGEGATFTMTVPVRLLSAEEAERLSSLAVSDNRSRAQSPQADAERPMSFTFAPPGTVMQTMSADLAESAAAGDAAAQEAIITHMMENLLAHAPDGFMCCTSGKPPVITYTSAGLTRLLGWAPEQLRGQSLHSLIHPDDVRSTAAVLKPLLEGERSSIYLMRRVRCSAPDAFRWMHISITHPTDPVNGYIYSVWRDATEFQDSQAALQEFLVTTSHDMRTPVHSVLTAAELLAARPSVIGDPEAAFLCHTICDSATLMLQVITNVMSFMREGNAAADEDLSPKRTEFDVQTLLDAALQACDAGGRHPHAVQLELDPDEPVPPRMEGDTARLKLILSNCVQWLLRRGYPLTARMRCHRVTGPHGDGGAAMLELQLQQRELHLSAEECDSIFSPFSQSPAESEGDTQSGLGLHAARVFARGMGGDVKALSSEQYGEGTVLRLCAPVHVLPGAMPQQPAAPVVLQKRTASDALGYYPPSPAPGERQRRPRALIVEDHLLNAKLVARLLARHGFEVSIASDGIQGLAILTAALRGGEGAPPLPDVVLSDLHMPGMGGADMVKKFRQVEAGATPGRRILILALSASVSDAHVAECTEAGMDGHISKPLRAELIPVLLQRIRDGGAACGMLAARME